jgi:hypothetical protein
MLIVMPLARQVVVVADVRERPQVRHRRRVQVRQVLRHRQAGEGAGADGTFQVIGALDPLLLHVPGQARLRLEVAVQELLGDVTDEAGALRVVAAVVDALLGPDPRHPVVCRLLRGVLRVVAALPLLGELAVDRQFLLVRVAQRLQLVLSAFLVCYRAAVRVHGRRDLHVLFHAEVRAALRTGLLVDELDGGQRAFLLLLRLLELDLRSDDEVVEGCHWVPLGRWGWGSLSRRRPPV